VYYVEQLADLEIGDTTGLETCATEIFFIPHFSSILPAF